MVDTVFQINANATIVQDFMSTVILENINIIINADARRFVNFKHHSEFSLLVVVCQ